MTWNWEERFFKMQIVNLDWEVKTVKLAVDALNDVANFTP